MKTRVKWILVGAAATVVLTCALGYLALVSGLIPANADAQPSSLERWAARTSLNASVRREGGTTVDPLPQTDANVEAGIKLYSANCLVCHGASDGKPSNISRGLYQHAPQLGRHGVEDDPEGETHWKIAHGVRLTGMPAFGATLTDTQIWQVTQLLKHMDALSPHVAAAWKKLPTQASPAGRAPRP